MIKKKNLNTFLLVLLLATITQSCKQIESDGRDVSASPSISNYSTVIPMESPIEKITDQNGNSSAYSAYQEKLDSFLQAVINFDYKASQSGYETYTHFSEVHTLFANVLRHMESTQDLELEQLSEAHTGFSVMFSEPHLMNETTYRIVKLSSTYTETMMGAFDGLYIQFWTDVEIGCVLIANTTTHSTGMKTLAGYAFHDDYGIVTVFMEQYNNVGKHEDTYSIIVYSIDDNQVTNMTPSAGFPVDNGFWEVSVQEYLFHDQTEPAYGLLISELGEDDNAHKTTIDIFEDKVTIRNGEAIESSISLEMINGIWKIS